jgi:general secretion pathway protein A
MMNVIDETPDFMRFYDMKQVPFTQQIAVDSLYQSALFKDVLGRLRFAVSQNKFTVLTGPVGSGKSTVLRAFNDSLDHDVFRVLYISESSLTPRWLYSVPLTELEIKPRFYTNDCKRQFHEYLLKETKVNHKRVVLIIDEAHLMNQYHCLQTLEEIRFLLNTDYDSHNPLTLILCGQDELWGLLSKDKSRAITQRIDVIAKLAPMDVPDISRYINAHLRYCETSSDVMSAEAVEAIAVASGGIPRIINKICTHALIYGASKAMKIINADVIQHVVETELPQAVMRF